MTSEMVLKLGRSLGYQLKTSLDRRPRVLIGKDTRLSGYLFETAMASGLVSVGADVLLVGPLPTPGIAFLTTECAAMQVWSYQSQPIRGQWDQVVRPRWLQAPRQRGAVA